MSEDTRSRTELAAACEIQQDQITRMENDAEQAYDLLDELVETSNEEQIAGLRVHLQNINSNLG